MSFVTRSDLNPDLKGAISTLNIGHAVTKNYTQQNTEIFGYDISLTSGGSEYEDTFGARLKKHGGDKGMNFLKPTCSHDLTKSFCM